MEVSKENIELIEKVKGYRTDEKLINELKIRNDSLVKQMEELEENIRVLKLNTIKKNKLLDDIRKLEEEKRELDLNIEKFKKSYTFIVTTSKGAPNTVSGEINTNLSKAKEEVLICSPWITYIVEELSNLKRDKNRPIRINVITRLMEEDIKNGITDLEKFRILKDDLGADIKYNNDLHAKMIIVDKSVAILSSANLTRKGMYVNYEAGISIKDKKMVNDAVYFFNDVWKESIPMTEKSIESYSKRK